RYERLLDDSPLEGPLLEDFRRLRPGSNEGWFSRTMRDLYDSRMKLTGQNGLSDYDRGFTDFLYTYERARSEGRVA
ncbi:MAG: hypothetical protein OEO23_16990, partial [Gemmatimonadota bacterium]|nr:hypothetical protein [Gemmatimonadota bacterium]